MTSKKLLTGISLFVVIVVVTLFLPLSSKEYQRDDRSADGTNDGYTNIKIVRHLLTAEMHIPRVPHGACDDIKFSASSENDVKVITVTTTNDSGQCTVQLVYSDAKHTFMWPIWEKRLIVKNFDKQLFDLP